MPSTCGIDVGVQQDRAEAHAEAARQLIMAELVTRYDLDALRRELEAKIDSAARSGGQDRRPFRSPDGPHGSDARGWSCSACRHYQALITAVGWARFPANSRM